MGYNSRKAQNQNLHAMQYRFNCQNDKTPNLLKTHKQTQNNACMGYRMPNLKNTVFYIWHSKFFLTKIGGRAMTGGKALTLILNN